MTSPSASPSSRAEVSKEGGIGVAVAVAVSVAVGIGVSVAVDVAVGASVATLTITARDEAMMLPASSNVLAPTT